MRAAIIAVILSATLTACAGSPLAVRTSSPTELANVPEAELCRAYRFDGFWKGADQANLKAEVRRRMLDCPPATYEEALTQARLGDVGSMNEVGWYHFRGLGVPQDYVEACRWFQTASDRGHLHATAGLAVCHERGVGGKKGIGEAVRLHRLAAEGGNALALNQLGEMYFKGTGVEKDLVQALKWYSLAATGGMGPGAAATRELAAKNREGAMRLVTSEQRAEAQRLAAAWTATRPDAVAMDEARPARPVVAAPSIPPVTSRTTFTFPKAAPRPDDVAVIIGNSEYAGRAKDIPPIPPAANDAAAMKRYATEALGIEEANVIYVSDATGSQLAEVFGTERDHRGKLFNWTKAGRSRVFVYYSGHGAPAGSDGRAVLVPSDASASQLSLSGYPLDLLYANLAKVPAESVSVVLEACFSGISPAGTVVPNASPVNIRAKIPQVPANMMVITAGAADQMASWEHDRSHGLFTKHFLLGQGGEADKAPYGNGDGTVGLDELRRYLDDKVTYLARRYYGREQNVQIVKGGGR
jgi:hypothetical protein